MHQLLTLHQQIHRALNDSQIEQQVFSELCQLYHSTVGLSLFTITALHPRQAQLTRVYSNRPKAYPEQGTMPVEQNNWKESVMERGEIFYGASLEAIKPYFQDWPTLQEMELNCVLNIPVLQEGECIGTVNILHTSLKAYDHCDRHLLMQYAQLLAPLLAKWREAQ